MTKRGVGDFGLRQELNLMGGSEKMKVQSLDPVDLIEGS